jgi:hypothetical protein
MKILPTRASFVSAVRRMVRGVDTYVLSPSQCGFRKGQGTRHCLASLTTDVQTSSGRKLQTVAAFIDISEAYDNVLIDILCDILREKEVPFIVAERVGFLCWRLGVYDISRL